MEKTPLQWAVEPFRKYATFSGRARRAEYWWFTLLYLIGNLALTAVDAASGTTPLIRSFVGLFIFVPGIAVAVRRLHDVNRSGWWTLMALVPGTTIGFLIGYQKGRALAGGVNEPFEPALIGICVIAVLVVLVPLLIWYCSRGTDGLNRFGPDPLRDNVSEVFD